MQLFKIISGFLIASMISGCVTVDSADGPRGPKLVGSSRATQTGDYYAEIGMRFSSPGDFFALVAPSRWKSPMKTGGSLSWLNPVAWSDDAMRTGRILVGEAVVVGGVVVAATAGGGSSGSSGGSDSSSAPHAPRADPPPIPDIL